MRFRLRGKLYFTFASLLILPSELKTIKMARNMFSPCHTRGTTLLSPHKESNLSPQGGIRIFSLSHARDETKNILLYFFTELKTYHLTN